MIETVSDEARLVRQHILLSSRCGRVEYFSGDDLGGPFVRVEQKAGSKFRSTGYNFTVCAQPAKREINSSPGVKAPGEKRSRK